jgi:hypothetical protein
MKSKSSNQWKKGRGKLGVLEPLIGGWTADADSPMGRIKCKRTFSRILSDKWILLEVDWEFARDKHYIEHAIYGVDADGRVSFWSFTSDGKCSQGILSDASDIHSEGIAFEARMPAGIARMAYWPEGDGCVNWTVESKTKKGWKRFTHHVYTRM